MPYAPSSVGGMAWAVRRLLTDAGVAAHEIDLLTQVVTGHVEPYVDEMPFFLVLQAVRMAGQKLRDRVPWESPDDICQRALSQSSWRSLARSLNRSVAIVPEVGRWGDWQRVSSNWRHRVCDTIVHAAQMGAGAAPSRPLALRGAGHDSDFTLPTPSLDFTCAGKTGYLLGALYASSLLPQQRCVARARHAAPANGTALASAPATLARGEPVPAPTPLRARTQSGCAACEASQAPATGTSSPPGSPQPHCVTPGQARPTAVDDAQTRLTNFVRDIGAAIASLATLGLPAAEAAGAGAFRTPGIVLRSAAWSAPPRRDEINFLTSSPAVRQLVDSANAWRHRNAVQSELHTTFAPSMALAMPADKDQLLEDLLEAQASLVGVDLSTLRLRRHRSIPGGQRHKAVKYWRLYDAAERILSGELNITAHGADVTFDVSQETPAGAVYEAPTLLTASRWMMIVTQWDIRCQARANMTWIMPARLADDANSELTQALQTALALSDLAMTNAYGLISRTALQTARHALVAALIPGNEDTVNHAHALQLSLDGSDSTHPATPAGTFVITQHARDGVALLYLMGEPLAWRAFDSPDALHDAIARNLDGLRDTLLARAPEAFRRSARTGGLTSALGDGPPTPPMQIARQATLAVMDAEAPLVLVAPATPARVDAYCRWLSGETNAAIEQALERTYATRKADGLPVASRAPLVPLQDIHYIERMQRLRASLSMAIPTPVALARRLAQGALARRGLTDVDPDDVYVMLSEPPVTVSLTNATITKMTSPQTTASGQLLQRPARTATATEPLRRDDGETPSPGARELLADMTPQGYAQQAIEAFGAFWHAHRREVRSVLKSEFIAQVRLQRAARTLSVEQANIAARIAGPIELSRLDASQLGQRIPAPNVRREWLTVQGRASTLLMIGAPQRNAKLLLAAYPDGLQVHGFESRQALDAWFLSQTRDDETRRKLARTFASPASSPAPSPATSAIVTDNWLAGRGPDTLGTAVTQPEDTFALLTDAYQRLSTHALGDDADSGSDTRWVNVMRAIANADLAFGVGSWVLPTTRPVGIGISMLDLALGTVGEIVGVATDRDDLRSQGWRSMLSAVGSQGIALARFRALGFLTGDAKFRYFIEEAPNRHERLIPGLYRSGGRLYASVDMATRAYTEFDPASGFFRLVPAERATGVAADGPLARLSSGGHWHTISPGDGAAPPLDDPLIAWRIEQGFRRRLDAVTSLRDRRFDDARRAVTTAQALEGQRLTAAGIRWQLRLLKLEFLDPAIDDVETLGTLAGRIGELQNLFDSSAVIAVGSLEQRAQAVGAGYIQISQSPRVFLSHIRAGLVRATAVAGLRGNPHLVVQRFNVLARLPPQASEPLMGDLSWIGSIESKFREVPAAPGAPGPEFATLFERAPDTSLAYQLNIGARRYLLGRSVNARGAASYYFLDPDTGMVIHHDPEALLDLAREHLNDAAHAYGLPTDGTPPLVDILEVDAERLSRTDIYRDPFRVLSVREALEV
ncbi:Toxin Afp18 [Pandoraea morbifera]|uniref:Toxin Afp18 n=1 Tax=Pandoraea morbifera TaxID=2508300 RepID=A0A5E4W277_9BURK|nr:DUF6543 domain-containing protein [Pandoraea morbifera]VVE17330.1 Toxin Afp18 [Pandoraea morbifera]